MSQTTAPIVAAIGRRTSGASTTTRPFRLGQNMQGAQRTAAKRPALLTVSRDRDGASGAIDGTVRLFTALLGMEFAGRTERLVGDGVRTQFQTGIPFVAFSNYNWLVRRLYALLGGVTGTVDKTAASATLTGTTTAFDTELWVGATIIVGGESRRVVSIASATSLTVDRPFNATAAGLTLNTEVPGFSGLTGTVAVTAGSIAVTGTSTKFTEELHENEDIIIAGVRYTIARIASDTALSLTTGAAATNAAARAFGEADQMLTQDATPDDAWDFGVTSGVDGNAIITLGAAPPARGELLVYRVTPTELLGDGEHAFERTQVLGGDVVWAVGTHATNNLSRVEARLEPSYTI